MVITAIVIIFLILAGLAAIPVLLIIYFVSKHKQRKNKEIKRMSEDPNYNFQKNIEPTKPRSVMWKIGLIVLLIIAMLIPLSMIGMVGSERKARQDEAMSDTINKWGGEQNIVGPILVVPYSNGKNAYNYAYLMPKTYQANSTLQSHPLHKGIFKTNAYVSTIKANGAFDLHELSSLGNKNWLTQKAFVVVGISEPKSIQQNPLLTFQGKARTLSSRDKDLALFDNGIYAATPINNLNEVIPFDLNMVVNGSSSYSIVPIGKQNKIEMASDWPSPNFDGSTYPTERKVNTNGFKANWSLPSYSHSYPQAFTDSLDKATEKLNESALKVGMYTPADFYQQSERATKYGILFFVLTFSTFFLIEVLTKVKLHPFQYILVGLALSLFYLILLAFSEVVGFGYAYLIASGTIISVITMYARAIMGKIKKMTPYIVAGMLSTLYGFLYVLLQLEDLSLLLGTVGLVIVLVVIMYVTRNIDWYNEQVSA